MVQSHKVGAGDAGSGGSLNDAGLHKRCIFYSAAEIYADYSCHVKSTCVYCLRKNISFGKHLFGKGRILAGRTDIHQVLPTHRRRRFCHMEALLAARTYKFSAGGGKLHFIHLAAQMAGGTLDFHMPARYSFRKFNLSYQEYSQR